MSGHDDELLERAVAGDGEALSRLLATYGSEVRATITGAIGQPWRAILDEDDVMQVTYVEAFLQITKFKPSGVASFRAWLKRIAEHNLQDAIKGLSRDKRPDPRNRGRAACRSSRGTKQRPPSGREKMSRAATGDTG